MQGWSATVNNRTATVKTVGGIFEAVAVPAGVSTVHFTFAPPHLMWALLAFFAGLAVLVGAGVWALWSGGTGPRLHEIDRAQPIRSGHSPS